MTSAILNAALDLVFLGLLGFGIVCSAVTTVVAEAVSAGLAAHYMAVKVPALNPAGSWKTDRRILRKRRRLGG